MAVLRHGDLKSTAARCDPLFGCDNRRIDGVGAVGAVFRKRAPG